MIGLAEGTSFLLLLAAMPVKYMLGHPEAVKIIGWIHGILFIWFIIALLWVQKSNQWSLKKILVAFLASLLPFGTFILDASLRREEEILVCDQAEIKI